MMKHNYKQLKLLLCSVLLGTSLSSTSHALIPVTDAGTLAQAITNNINLALELKSVKNVVELAGTMNTTIGEALSTFNEYVTTYYDYKNQVENIVKNPEEFVGGIIKDELGKQGIDLNGISSGGGNSGGGSGTGGAGMTANLTGIGTSNGFLVFPNELADHCDLNVGEIRKLEDKDKVVNCLKLLITERNAENKETQREARDIYVKSFHETAYSNIAEAVVLRNYAVNYEKQVLEPLSEKLKKAKTVRDDYSGVIMVNKEVANLINKVLMMYSAKVAYDAFSDYGDFEIYEEDTLNIGDSK